MPVLTRSRSFENLCQADACTEPPIVKDDEFCLPHKIDELKEFIKKRKLVVINSDPSKHIKILCTHVGCSNIGSMKGLCARHSGRWGCKMPGCKKLRQGGGFCKAHGGIQTNKKCAHEGCVKFSQGGGLCYSHGGGRRCPMDGCKRRMKADLGVCTVHVKSVSTRAIMKTIEQSS